MPSFLLLAGLGSYLVVGLLCVAAFAVAGVAAYFYLRAKNREALDPAKGLVAGDSPVALGEMRELTSRIEEIVTTQQDHGETQRAHLSRKIDQVRESVESQHHAVTGLRHELRHEIGRRDSEIHEIRHQIAAVREELALPPVEFKALPPSAGELGAPETEAEMTPLSFDAPEEATFTETYGGVGEASAFDEMAFAPLDAGPEGATPAGLAFTFKEDEPLDEAPAFFFEDIGFGSASDAPSFEEAPDPLDPGASPEFAFEEDSFDVPPPTFSFEEEGLPEAEPAPEPPVFSFEEDEAPAEAPPVQVARATEAPMFSFEEDEPAEPLSAEIPAAPESPAFSFEEEPASVSSAPESDEAFQVVSFLEPEGANAETEQDETDEQESANAPMALVVDDEEVSMTGYVAMEAAQAAVAGARYGAPSAASSSVASSPRFAPPLSDPSGDAGVGEAPSVWISRPDRQPSESPVETIGGIAVERVGDVPPVEPVAEPSAEAAAAEAAAEAAAAEAAAAEAAAAEAAAEAEAAAAEAAEAEAAEAAAVEAAAAEAAAADLSPAEPASAPDPAPLPEPVAFEDEFPTPVVASELAVESLDFGIDVDAELAAAGQAPVDERPVSEPIRHAPVPPLRMEVTSPAAEAAPESTPVESAPAPRGEDEPEEVEAYVPPEGAEDLTVISSVDADTMRALHMTGVLTLDEIARWGRSDARRVAGEVGVAEETIMHQWIFEAQSALFERYSRR